MICKYLFLIEKENIRTYNYRDNEFDIVKYKGDNLYRGEIELFWNWWESKSSYIKEFDTIDFCFINVNSEVYNLDFNMDYYSIEEYTSWNEDIVRKFIRIHTNLSETQLVDANCENITLNEKSIIIELFPRKCIINSVKNKMTQAEIDSISSEESIIAKYYRNKTMEIKNTVIK